MTCSKLSFFLVVLMLITLSVFIAKLEAQDAETNRALVQEFVKKAKELVKQNKTEEAIELYERIVKAAPDDFESYIKLATLYETEGNEDAAIENYKKASVYEHGDKKVYLRLAEHFFLNEDMTAVEAALKNAILSTTSEWEQESIERQLLNLYRYQGKFEEMLQKAEAEGTLTSEMQKQRAQYFYNTGDLEKAAFYFEKAIEIEKSSYDQNQMTNELLNIYLKQDREDLVLAFYENEGSKLTRSEYISASFNWSGITITYAGDDIRKTLIDIYKSRGQLEELRTYFESKLEEDATNPAILELLADIYWDTSDYQKAAETYHLLGKIEPIKRRNIRSLYHAAAAFHKSNQSDRVNAVLNQADNALASINDRHDSTYLLGALATICLKNKMLDPAIKLAEKAVSEADTEFHDLELEVMYEILAKSYLGTKRYEDGFKAYQQMANVDRGYYQDRAESGMNEAAKAGKLYEKWIPEQLKQVAENPNNPEHILKLAQSYEATNKTKAAVAQYERLAELEPENSQWYKKLGTLYQNLPQETRETGRETGRETVTGTEVSNTEQSAKSIDAYGRAIQLEPNSYQLYDLLAQTYLNSAQISQTEETYRRALDAQLSQSDHDAAIRAIIGLYADEGQENKQTAILEEIRQKLPKMDKSAVLHEQLGDLYKKIDDSDKAASAYDKWLEIRQKELYSVQNASYYFDFAEKLLDKALYPEIALLYAKRAFHNYSGYKYQYPVPLGRAYVANGLYDEALQYFKYALSLIPISHEHYTDMLWEDIAEVIKIANDKERYIQMLDALIDSMPSASSHVPSKIYAIFAEYYAENDKPENAKKYLLKTGFVPENAWITLGPFDNKDNVGYYTAYIPEKTTQIDTTAKYFGKDKDRLISWEKSIDNKSDGRYDFGNDDGINDWSAAYLWAVVISPDARDITFRFDSDDQGIIWLNGQKVFEHSREGVGGGAVQIDRHTIPVTLKQGENTILIKVCNATQIWDMYMRLTDADGNSLEDLKFKTADALLNAPPPKPIFNVNVNRGLAEYYSINNMPDKAMEQMRQTGMLHENTWLVLGPFDNTVGIGYNTAYISENTTQIDLTAKYHGVNEQISWKKFTDTAFDGFIDFGEDIDWRVAYSWTTITSPDEREVLFRFCSDDQSKIWLNGTEVFADSNAQTAILDKNTIPVTFKAGENTILVKVCNEEMSWGFYLRVTDTDGKPYEDMKIDDVQEIKEGTVNLQK